MSTADPIRPTTSPSDAVSAPVAKRPYAVPRLTAHGPVPAATADEAHSLRATG